MRLTDLDAKLSQAQLSFRCPMCGTHQIVVPFEGRVTWQRAGETIDELTVSPSIKTTTILPYLEIPKPGERRRCVFHGFVTKGGVSVLGDSGVTAAP